MLGPSPGGSAAQVRAGTAQVRTGTSAAVHINRKPAGMPNDCVAGRARLKRQLDVAEGAVRRGQLERGGGILHAVRARAAPGHATTAAEVERGVQEVERSGGVVDGQAMRVEQVQHLQTK